MLSLWQQGRIVSAYNSYRLREASIRSLEERDRSRCHSAHPAEGCGVGHWDGAVTVRVGRPSVVWLCGPDMGGVQYAPRWLYSAQKDPRGALHYQSELSLANQPCPMEPRPGC